MPLLNRWFQPRPLAVTYILLGSFAQLVGMLIGYYLGNPFFRWRIQNLFWAVVNWVQSWF